MDCTHDNLVKLFWNGENEKKERLKINEEGIKYAFFMALKDFTPRTEKREESVSFAAKDMLEELEKSDTHIELEPYSKKFLDFFDEKEKNEKEFDDWHEKICEDFLKRFRLKDNKYGKAQKVINMTFKYIYCLEGAKEREDYFRFCHMPLDSITLEWFYRLKEKGVKIAHVTLHVGLGTFRPVKVENILEHHMHSEFYMVDEEDAKMINDTKANGGRVISVGTTSTRTLETVADENGVIHAGSGWTQIFIYPGYKFKAIDCLITNFHLPESTLLMLVSALAGRDNILNAYKTAVEEKYRFFSFGDAMFITNESDVK